MRIVAVSDTHGLHEDIVLPAGDVLVHAGDFTLGGHPRELEAFFGWFSVQPHPHKIVIAGNHDLLFETAPGDARTMVPANVVYLEDSGCQVEGLKVWGSPWQPWFMNWAFNLETEEQRQAKWDLIPAEIDVLVTHGPPFGILDRCYDGRHVGCAALGRAVRQIRPAVHVFGHIHEGYGQVMRGGVSFLNACVCDYLYRPVNPPLILDIG